MTNADKVRQAIASCHKQQENIFTLQAMYAVLDQEVTQRQARNTITSMLIKTKELEHTGACTYRILGLREVGQADHQSHPRKAKSTEWKPEWAEVWPHVFAGMKERHARKRT